MRNVPRISPLALGACVARLAALSAVWLVCGAGAEARAQGGSVGPSTGPPECFVKLSVPSVKYLGKDDRKDRVLVEWAVTGPQSPCVKITGFSVDLAVTRRRGNRDVGSAKGLAFSARSVVVDVPRGVAETDPVSYTVQVEANTQADGERTVELKGNGPPVFVPGSPPGAAPPDPCQPSLRFDKVNFFPGQGGKDSLGVFWKAELPSKCMTFHESTVTVRLTRVDGRVESRSVVPGVDPNLTSANVEFPAGAAVDSHQITLRARTRILSIARRATAQRQGSF